MYDKHVNTFLFNFTKQISVTELGFSNKENIQVPIILDQSNFDFSRIRSDGGDIRFSEIESGKNSLFYWVSDFDYNNKNAVIWVEIPELMKNETKIIYMFFGNGSMYSTSNINNLNFVFKYNFNYTPLSSSIFSGILNRGVDADGYSLNSDTTYFSTITNPIKGLHRWEVFTNLIYSDSISDVYLEFLGGENKIHFRFNNIDNITNNVRTGSNQTYTDLQSGCEPNSYNLLNFAYDLTTDTFFYKALARNSFIDYSWAMERSVEGNTEVDTIKIRGADGVDARIKYLLVRKYILDELSIDLSELYPEDGDYYNSVFVDTELYSPDVLSPIYHHESNVGGLPSVISNDRYDDYDSAWVSNDEVTSGYILIDFSRSSTNAVDSSYRHISSGGTGVYTAHRLSNYVLTEGDYWLGRQTCGIACIDFDDNPKQINCLVLHGYDEPGMVKKFRFKGSYKNPMNNYTDWMVLYEGECARSGDKQYFYFRNFNKYRYYMLEVLSTYGSNIKLKSWYMYTMPNADVFDGVTVDRISLRPSMYGSNANSFPRSISLEASNDYVTWVPMLNNVYTYSPFSESLYEYWQHFAFNNNNKYRIYKLLLDGTWGGIDKFIIDGMQLSQSLDEKRTHRVLQTTDSNMLCLYVDDSTGFDSGWLYGVNRDDFFYIKDNYLARKNQLSKGFDLTSLFLSITK